MSSISSEVIVNSTIVWERVLFPFATRSIGTSQNKAPSLANSRNLTKGDCLISSSYGADVRTSPNLFSLRSTRSRISGSVSRHRKSLRRARANRRYRIFLLALMLEIAPVSSGPVRRTNRRSRPTSERERRVSCARLSHDTFQNWAPSVAE